MKYIDEYRSKDLVQKLAEKIKAANIKPVRFMEVCGGHTMAIHKFGIRSLLPEQIKLISGPGCPVCVTDIRFIDTVIAYARQANTTIATFGDLIRIPGSSSSLGAEKANGADIRLVLSPFDALELAKKYPQRTLIFPGIGFETTAPGTAAAILEAEKQSLRNFLVLSAHKLMPPAMRGIIDDEVTIDGYMAPGHVSAITGSGIYDFIPREYNIPVVIAGFEPVDMLQSIYMLLHQHRKQQATVEIQYKRAVSVEGNRKAQRIMKKVFEPGNDWWRGLGVLTESGLKIRKAYESFDALTVMPVSVEQPREPLGCICGKVLKGTHEPEECALFAGACTPEHPVGACMVSNEGSCHARYKYQTIA